ncbi:MAG: CHASE2 domain-containing protein [Alphaproteobacteria bacterium]|nr:CHASE2 domain-containing protein [Alphaproteobacteria bacterium]
MKQTERPPFVRRERPVPPDRRPPPRQRPAPAPAVSEKTPTRSPNVMTFMIRAMVYEVWVVGITGVAVTVLLFVALGSGITDLYLQFRGVAPVSGHVAQVTIGEEALYLWDPSSPNPEVTPRGLLAEVVRFLDEAGARVIVLDILLDQPAEDDLVLAEAARRHGAVVAAERYILTEPATGLQFQRGLVPAYDGAVAGGFANLHLQTTILSEDLLVRGTPLVKRVTRARVEGRWPGNIVGAMQDDGAIVPSMALAAAWMYRQRQQGLSSRVVDFEHLLTERCRGTPLWCDLRLTDVGLPDVPVGLAQVLPINFRAPEHSDPIPTVRAADILRIAGQSALMRQLDPTIEVEVPQQYRAVLRDKLVVVGRAGFDDSGDRFITPFGFPAYLQADMAGCRVQAQIVDTLLSGRHVRLYRGAIAWFGASVLFGIVVLSYRQTSDRVHVTGWGAAGAGLVFFGAALFRLSDGIAIDTGPPVAGILCGLLWTHIRAWAQESME